jgi:hypothetical protein
MFKMNGFFRIHSFIYDSLSLFKKTVNKQGHPISDANSNDLFIQSDTSPDFEDEAIKDYLVDYHKCAKKGRLDLSDISVNAIQRACSSLESEVSNRRLFKHQGRETAKEMMKWVVEMGKSKKRAQARQMKAMMGRIMYLDMPEEHGAKQRPARRVPYGVLSVPAMAKHDVSRPASWPVPVDLIETSWDHVTDGSR